MEIQTVITKGQTESLTLAELQALAHNRHAFGDDIVTLFDKQSERRVASAGAVLEQAKTEQRDLLASENREFDRAMKEADAIRTMKKIVEDRTVQRAFVPPTQRTQDTKRVGLFGTDEFRALVGNTGAGSYVAPDEASSSFFDKLSAASVALQSGVRVIRTDRDALRVPRVLADPSVSWTSEGSQISPADPNYDEVVATPRKLTALTLVSNELVMDSNPSVLDLLEMQLARAIALKFDLGFLEGSGTPPEIYGMKNVVGINTAGSPGGTGTAAGGFVNLDFMASAIGQLFTDNATPGVAVMHPRTWTQLIKIKEQTSSNNKPLLQDSAGAGTDGVRRSLYGVPVLLSSQLSLTETQTTSTTAAASTCTTRARSWSCAGWICGSKSIVRSSSTMTRLRSVR